MMRLVDPFSFEVTDMGTASVDPDGRPDSRWQNGTPPRFKTTLEIEFGRDDVDELRKIIVSLGGRWPW